jgi:hypothetical protein
VKFPGPTRATRTVSRSLANGGYPGGKRTLATPTATAGFMLGGLLPHLDSAGRVGNQFLRIRVARCFVNLVRWSLICPGQVAPAATCAIGSGAEPPGSLGGS